jgi:hypothetical protein
MNEKMKKLQKISKDKEFLCPLKRAKKRDGGRTEPSLYSAHATPASSA